MGSGKSGGPKKEKSLDILLDTLLSVKANRIGRAFITQGERMNRVRKVVLRLADPFAYYGEQRIRSGHTTPFLPARPAIQ